MRYFYIICLVLSSLFIYKPTSADEQAIKYAFFVPQNAFQSNLENDIYQEADHQNKEKNITSQSVKTKSLPQRQPQTIKKTTNRLPKKVSKSDVNKKTTPDLHKNKKQITKRSPQKEYTAKKTDNRFTKPETIENIPFKKFQTKSIDEMLKTIPYADSSQPRYKQLYYIYTLDLAVLYNTGALPPNFNQEETLAKAGSFRHQKYQD